MFHSHPRSSLGFYRKTKKYSHNTNICCEDCSADKLPSVRRQLLFSFFSFAHQLSMLAIKKGSFVIHHFILCHGNPFTSISNVPQVLILEIPASSGMDGFKIVTLMILANFPFLEYLIMICF